MKDILIPIKLFSWSKDSVMEVPGAAGIMTYMGIASGGWMMPGRYQLWTLVAELSDLRDWLKRPPREFTIVGDRAEIDFRFFANDLDPSGEEVVGWRYVPCDGQKQILDRAMVTVLIVND